MKLTLMLVAASLSIDSLCQGLYFPPANYADSSALAQCMPALAKQVMLNYKNSDKIKYWDNLFRYQLVTNDYRAARGSIDSLRKQYKSSDSESLTRSIQYESYILAKELQQKSEHEFKVLYAKILNDLYARLPENIQPLVQDYFAVSLTTLKDKLATMLEKITNTHSDSISLINASELCRAYNAYTVFCQIKPEANQFFLNEERKKFIIQDSILLQTKEGAQLSVLLARLSKNTNPQPVVLMYSIYADNSYDRTTVKEIALRGYVGMVVNTRGKYLSPQKIEPFEHDAADSYAILDWISKQPWCNGKIGMYGGSYLGFSQWSAVKKIHPALKTIVPQVAVGVGIDYPMHNNVFMSYMLQWIHYVSNTTSVDAAEFFDETRWNDLYSRWYTSGKSFRSLDWLDGRPNAIFQRWLDHPAYDAYWQNMVPHKKEFAKINIPILTITGYFDDDQRGAFFYFNEHYQYNKNARHYLLIGPYDHYGAQSKPKHYLRGYTLDSVANIDITETVFRWFDYILKDKPMPALLKDKINYQVIGSNAWSHAPSLDKINNDTLTFYLSHTRLAGHYELLDKKPLTCQHIVQEISYTDRRDANLNTPELVFDSTIQSAERLTFISKPLEKPFDINGSFTGEIKLTTNKKDIDLLIELYELQPDGKYFKLSSYLTRASYANNRSKRHLLSPGKEATIPINNSYFISKKISKGSCLIVVAGINKKNNWQINYGSGKDVSDETIEDGKVALRIAWSTNSTIQIPILK